MKYVSIAAIVICGLASACSVRNERTVVERPAPATTVVPAQTVVYTDPTPAPATRTVVVPAR